MDSRVNRHKQKTGQRAESLAAAAPEKAGYTILERNWRCAIGEIDLVARHRGEIVIVEVRARAVGTDAALESILPDKRDRLIKLADAYLDAHDLTDESCRIDVVAVGLDSPSPTVEIVENAVGW
jgi:putative endonuclease